MHAVADRDHNLSIRERRLRRRGFLGREETGDRQKNEDENAGHGFWGIVRISRRKNGCGREVRMGTRFPGKLGANWKHSAEGASLWSQSSLTEPGAKSRRPPIRRFSMSCEMSWSCPDLSSVVA